MSNCTPGIFGRSQPHRFEARYNHCGPVGNIKSPPIPTDNETTMFLAAIKRVYVGDICTRCGEWRPSPTPTGAS